MTFILNFHGIGEPGRPFEPGEQPYWIAKDRFAHLLDRITALPVPVEITFDDGNASDYEHGVPELRRRRLRAQFFVLAGKLGDPGYLTADQVAEIDDDPLFSIGSHGMDHQSWPELDDEELLRETEQSRARLSQICGREITHAALPLGRYDRRTLKRLADQGYTVIYSSDGSQALGRPNPVPRFSIREDVADHQLIELIRGSRRIERRLKQSIRTAIKARL